MVNNNHAGTGACHSGFTLQNEAIHIRSAGVIDTAMTLHETQWRELILVMSFGRMFMRRLHRGVGL